MALTEAVKRCGDCKEVVRAFLANGWSPDGQLEVILITFVNLHPMYSLPSCTLCIRMGDRWYIYLQRRAATTR